MYQVTKPGRLSSELGPGEEVRAKIREPYAGVVCRTWEVLSEQGCGGTDPARGTGQEFSGWNTVTAGNGLQERSLRSQQVGEPPGASAHCPDRKVRRVLGAAHSTRGGIPRLQVCLTSFHLVVIVLMPPNFLVYI